MSDIVQLIIAICGSCVILSVIGALLVIWILRKVGNLVEKEIENDRKKGIGGN